MHVSGFRVLELQILVLWGHELDTVTSPSGTLAHVSHNIQHSSQRCLHLLRFEVPCTQAIALLCILQGLNLHSKLRTTLSMSGASTMEIVEKILAKNPTRASAPLHTIVATTAATSLSLTVYNPSQLACLHI